MRALSRRLAARLTLLAGLALASNSAAQEAPPTPAAEVAKARFQAGAEAFAQGRYKDAIDLFSDAHRLTPNPAFSYNIGLAYEQLGDAPNALRHYREYLRNLPDAPDRLDVEMRIAAAEARLIERGVQQLTVRSVPDAATVLVDGTPVGVTPWTGELVPGAHTISLRHRGYLDLARAITLPAEQASEIELTLEREPAPPATARGPGATTLAEPDARSSAGAGDVSPVTWSFLALGTAGLGVALGLEIARGSAEDDAASAKTALDTKDAYDRARSFETGARIALVVGGAAAAAGGALLYLDLTSGEATASRGAGALAAGGGCDGTGCGVEVLGRF